MQIRGGGRESGFTFIEMILSAVLLLIMTVVISQSLRVLSRSNAFSESQSRLAEFADRMIHTASSDTTFSVWIFCDDLESDAYLDSLEFGDKAPVSWSQLPKATDHNKVVPDLPGVSETGNMLFLGRNVGALNLALDSGGAGSELVRIDTLRLVVWFLSEGDDGTLDLVRWGSEELARHKDLQSVPVELQDDLIDKLAARGIRFAWDPGQSFSSGLFQLDVSKGIQPLANDKSIPADPTQSRSGLLGEQRRVAVAENNSLRTVQVPAYAEATGRFPAGFEVKVDGVPVSRLVMLRIALTGSTQRLTNFAQAFRLVSCREG